jgi:soluble lytic murein transglycosylase
MQFPSILASMCRRPRSVAPALVLSALAACALTLFAPAAALAQNNCR